MSGGGAVASAAVAVAVKAPVAWSVRGSYQFPAPPRPVWAYSCGVGAVVVVLAGEAAVEVRVWFASRSYREGGGLVGWRVVRLGGEGTVMVMVVVRGESRMRAGEWFWGSCSAVPCCCFGSRLGAVERPGRS